MVFPNAKNSKCLVNLDNLGAVNGRAGECSELFIDGKFHRVSENIEYIEKKLVESGVKIV